MDELINNLEDAVWRALHRDVGAKDSVLVIVKHVAYTQSLSPEQRDRLWQLLDKIKGHK